MGRNLSPALRRELENLDKDANSRKSAMKALKSYVKDLDSKAIPVFLAQVSETKESGLSSGEYTISLFEVLARVHGPKIVSQIDSIMSTVIKTLTSSAGSFALHQACSKVVPAIARYGIDPTTPEDKRRHIIHSLCKPLSDSLLVSRENLSSGSALCLKALVDSDNWRFASVEMVNEVCQRVAGALEKPMLSNSHMALVMALAKHNGLIVEAYARLLIQSGLRILNMGVSERNSQRRLSAIQMVNFLMKCLDPKSIISELGIVMEEMEKCQSDQMAFVSGAAFEALQTAKRIATEKGSKFDRDLGMVTRTNSGKRGNSGRRNIWGSGDQSPPLTSPESQTIDSFGGCTSMVDSPFSTSFGSSDFDYDRRSVDRKLWSYEQGGVDFSLKDGLFSDMTNRSVIENYEHDAFSENHGGYADGCEGFLQPSPVNRNLRSANPSPQRSRSHISVDNVKILTTPRKLFYSLQDANDDLSEKQARRYKRSPSSRKFDWSLTSAYDQNDLEQDIKSDESLPNGNEQLSGSTESVSSTDDIHTEGENSYESQEMVPETPTRAQCQKVEKGQRTSLLSMVCGPFMVLVAILICFILVGNLDKGHDFIPT